MSSPRRILIERGTIATASELFEGDLLIEDGKVTRWGTALGEGAGPVDLRVDATGRYVLPGGIDPHTHLDMPSGGGLVTADDFESGTQAAAFGGTTCVIDFATPPLGGALSLGLEDWHRRAEGKACVDYAFHMVVNTLRPSTLEEMDAMVRQHGVPSFKLFTAYPGRLMLDDASIFRALQRTGENGGLICLHAENGPVIDVLIAQALARGHTAPRQHALTRPPRLEAEATHRVLALAEVAGVPVYVVHLSAAEALAELRAARDRGVRAFAETCPQYLFLSQDDYEGPQADRFVMSPPLRPREHQEVLWRGLARDDLALVATDHCPYCLSDKARGRDDFTQIPNGAPGIESRLSLLWDEGVRRGRIDVNRFVQVTSTAAAKLFGLYPKKGTLAPGADADVLVWDPDRELRWSAKTHHSRVDYQPYEGRVTRGAPTHVFSRGELLVQEDRWLGRAGHGRFVRRGELWRR